jgi:hypothetical protein
MSDHQNVKYHNRMSHPFHHLCVKIRLKAHLDGPTMRRPATCSLHPHVHMHFSLTFDIGAAAASG